MALAYHQRTHMCDELRAEHAGQKVLLAGWVQAYRDHGGMVFIDLRDRGGLTQIKFNPETDPETHQVAHSLRAEDCICVRGDVSLRGENVNPKLPTGEIEVNGREVDILSMSDNPPFEIADDVDAHEELRLRYRFLDLRRPVMQSIMRLRHRISKVVRDYFDEQGFLEIETPFLTKSTPEGARDYLVPSRVQQGAFYALPQSPQLFKQLFMIAGFDRYAQVVRCFRDEDLRADRQPEFTQIDIEMSFAQPETVMEVMEGMVQRVFGDVLGVDVSLPLPRMSYAEAMIDVTEVVRGTEFGLFRKALDAGGVVKCLVAPQGAESLTRKITDGLGEEIRGIGGGGLPLAKVVQGPDGPEFSTGVAKFMQPLCKPLCGVTGAEIGDVILFMPGSFEEVCKYLHYARTRLAEIMKIIPPGVWKPLWIVDFPLFVWDDQERRWFSSHHPFTAPADEDLDKLESAPGGVRSKAYDMVLNGTEMGGGSIRIHDREVQGRVFKVLGISEEEARLKFEHLMEALRFGAPPHGGIAFGLDRWVMMLAGRDSLRDVIAFPKTTRAACLLTGAPAWVEDAQLAELGLEHTPAVRAKRDAEEGPA